ALDQILVCPREPGHHLSRPVRQLVSVAQKHADVVGVWTRAQRCQMIGDGFAELASRRGLPSDDRLKVGDEILDAPLPNRAERPPPAEKISKGAGPAARGPAPRCRGCWRRHSLFQRTPPPPYRAPRDSGAPIAGWAPIGRWLALTFAAIFYRMIERKQQETS